MTALQNLCVKVMLTVAGRHVARLPFCSPVSPLQLLRTSPCFASGQCVTACLMLWPASSSPLQHHGDEIACWTGAPDPVSHRLSWSDSASHWAGETKMAAVAPVAGCSGRAGPDQSVRCGAPAWPHCRAVQSLQRSSAAVTGNTRAQVSPATLAKYRLSINPVQLLKTCHILFRLLFNELAARRPNC